MKGLVRVLHGDLLELHEGNEIITRISNDYYDLRLQRTQDLCPKLNSWSNEKCSVQSHQTCTYIYGSKCPLIWTKSDSHCIIWTPQHLVSCHYRVKEWCIPLGEAITHCFSLSFPPAVHTHCHGIMFRAATSLWFHGKCDFPQNCVFLSEIWKILQLTP